MENWGGGHKMELEAYGIIFLKKALAFQIAKSHMFIVEK